MDLFYYIQKELSSLVKQASKKQSKKSASFSNLRKLISASPLPEDRRQSIFNSVAILQQTIQSTVKHPSQPRKLFSAMGPRKASTREVFLEHMINDEKAIARESLQTARKSKEIQKLTSKLEKLREYRLSREGYLQELVVKVQRLERIKHYRIDEQDDEETYLRSKGSSRCKNRKTGGLQPGIDLREEVRKTIGCNFKELISIYSRK